MSLTGVRVVALFTLFGLTMIAGLGPVLVFNLWRRRREGTQSTFQRNDSTSTSAKVLQLLLVFGGGVLLATCFVHMIPEIRENYNHLRHDRDSIGTNNKETITTSSIAMKDSSGNISSGFSDDDVVVYKHSIDHHVEDEHTDGHEIPWIEICICCGLFFTYFIEESVLLLVGRDSTHHHHHHNHPINHINHHHLHHHHSTLENREEGKRGCDNIAVDLKDDDLVPTTFTVPDTNSHTSENQQHHIYNSSVDEDDNKLWSRFLRGLVVVVAFLAHSIFDGIAIGLQTTPNSVWTMLFAICLHKLVVVFAIGFELYEKTRSLLLTSIHMIIFSSMSPFGIFLSIVIESGLTEDGNLTLVLLNAAATGGILYIVFLEILQADRCPAINGLVQLMALMCGFILMTLLTIMVGHDHGHE